MTKRPAGTAQTRTALRTQRVIVTHHTQPLLAAMALFAAATPTSTTQVVSTLPAPSAAWPASWPPWTARH